MQAAERAKKSEQAIIACSGVVGMTGFEPAASWSQIYNKKFFRAFQALYNPFV